MSKTVFLLQRTLSQSRKLCQPGSIWSPPWPHYYWVPNLIGENIPPTSFPNCPNCCAQHLTQLSLVINPPNLNCSGRGFVKKKVKVKFRVKPIPNSNERQRSDRKLWKQMRFESWKWAELCLLRQARTTLRKGSLQKNFRQKATKKR